MGTFAMLFRRGGGGTLYMGTLFALKQPTSSTPCTIGVSAGGRRLALGHWPGILLQDHARFLEKIR